MKNNELRIGNLVLFNNEVVDITGIVKSGFYFGKHGFAINLLEWFQPIPLNEKWLLKAGFEKDDSGVDMFDQDYCEWYQKEFPIIGLICQSSDKSYIFDENTDTLRLKYVHELQNLYFALTGSELVFSTEP